MNIEARKLELIEFLINLKDENLINKIEAAIKESQKEDDTLTKFTLEQYVDRVKIAEEDFKSGRFKTQEKLEIDSETW